MWRGNCNPKLSINWLRTLSGGLRDIAPLASLRCVMCSPSPPSYGVIHSLCEMTNHNCAVQHFNHIYEDPMIMVDITMDKGYEGVPASVVMNKYFSQNE